MSCLAILVSINPTFLWHVNWPQFMSISRFLDFPVILFLCQQLVYDPISHAFIIIDTFFLYIINILDGSELFVRRKMKPYRSEFDVLIFIAWFLIVSGWIQLNQTLVSSNNARSSRFSCTWSISNCLLILTLFTLWALIIVIWSTCYDTGIK